MSAFIITFSLLFFHDATYYNFDIHDCDTTDYTETLRHIKQEHDNMSKWFSVLQTMASINSKKLWGQLNMETSWYVIQNVKLFKIKSASQMIPSYFNGPLYKINLKMSSHNAEIFKENSLN